MTDTAICAQQLASSTRTGVVDRFDLNVPPGIALSPLGPNGSGKTALVAAPFANVRRRALFAGCGIRRGGTLTTC